MDCGFLLALEGALMRRFTSCKDRMGSCRRMPPSFTLAPATISLTTERCGHRSRCRGGAH